MSSVSLVWLLRYLTVIRTYVVWICVLLYSPLRSGYLYMVTFFSSCIPLLLYHSVVLPALHVFSCPFSEWGGMFLRDEGLVTLGSRLHPPLSTGVGCVSATHPSLPIYHRCLPPMHKRLFYDLPFTNSFLKPISIPLAFPPTRYTPSVPQPAKLFILPYIVVSYLPPPLSLLSRNPNQFSTSFPKL